MCTLNEAIDLTPYAADTSAEDGTPDISPERSVFVADASPLVYLEYTRGGHLANLRRNTNVAVVCFDAEAEPRYVRIRVDKVVRGRTAHRA